MFEEWIKILEKDLNTQRLEHSLRVMKTSETLAKIYDVDVEKAKIAGLLHDCCKYKDKDKILKEVKKRNIDLDKIMKESFEIIHAELGYHIAREIFGIEDKDILNAIRYHTIAREDMTKLEKIVYLADLIEPMRNFPNVEIIRDLAYEDLDKALLYALNHSINYLLKKNALIHPNTLAARNHIMIYN